MPDPRTFPIDELTTGRYTGTLTGNDGVTPLSGAALATFLLTLYVIKADGTDTLIRDHVSILNANNVTIGTDGAVVWLIQTTDTTLVEAIPFERHIALFEWTWAGGAGKHEVILVVRNLHKVP